MTTALRDSFAARFNVSRETLDALTTYETLLQKWSPSINLVARSTLATVWERHFLDSAQVFAHAPQGATSWLDLGSGGGLPGLVVAIMARELNSGLRVTMVESDIRKCVFLQEVARQVGVSVNVRNMRIEALPPAPHDVVSARALAALPLLLAYAAPHLAPGGKCLFLKGERVESELTSAAADWHIEVEQIESLTDPAARILSISEVHRVH
ncbi:16S rRNA (guanine(527)-N(7))-methyltransferase RsmG [Oceanicella sp. SM1341]|uniref:16S rRNA (guanine(527)-N(7))-methyltransferase RsmG n=1 Tax=Oceanicella sp. SM1341 TaxID=1548889 RepID=UPI000E4D8C81|nr:16S rRNA (guanine(527)-N(7))-methyltransferase RsmG [Oceanicella sp. SM1341]